MAAKMRNTTMKKQLAAVALLAASLALPCRPSFASTVSVAAGDDIKALIEGASSGDLVELAAGTHRPSGEIAVPAGVTVRGAGRGATIVLGAGLTSRAFCVTNAASRLESFTVTGYTNSVSSAIVGGNKGGVIYMTAGTLDNLLVTFNKHCHADQGGGIYFAGGGMITNCVVSHNWKQKKSDGCGIYASASVGSQIVIVDCTVEDNWFDAKGVTYTCNGGGIYATRKVSVLRCVVRDNGNKNISSLNSYTGFGDGLYVIGYDARNIAVVDGCLVEGNAQTGVHLNGKTEMRNCIVCGHSTINKSGKNISAGVTAKGGNNSIYNCTIYGNTIDQAGSGLWLDGAEKAVNNIVYGNGNLGDVYVGASATFNTNIVGAAVSSDVGNIVEDPLFTDAANGDFTLVSAASPAVDAGATIASVATDFTGLARPEGAAYDIGAYERVYDPNEKSLMVVFDSTTLRHSGEAIEAHAAVSGVEAEEIASVAWYANGGAVSGATGLSVSLDDYATGDLTLRCVITLSDESVIEGFATQTIAVAPSVVYVSKTGSDTAPYDSWEKATPDLAAAIGAAVPAVGVSVTVHVASGDYTLSRQIDLLLPVRIVGAGSDTTTFNCSGFTADKELFIVGPNSSISGATFDGGDVNSSASGGAGGLFSIRGGMLFDIVAQNYRPYGASVVYMVGGLVTNCTVRNNQSRNGGFGFAMRLEGGEVVDCVVSNNTANNNGYGIRGMGCYLGGAATVRRCLVTGNYNKNSENQHYESNMGAGIRLNHANALAENCVIVSNGFQNVYIDGGGTLRNCLVTGGVLKSLTQTVSPGIHAKNGFIYNCTSVDNTNKVDAALGDLYMSGGTAKNNIAPLATVAGGTAANNLWRDPGFKNAAALDFHLKGASDAVNAGDNAVWQGVENAVDLDGNPRIFRKIVDLGCYECQTAARTVLLVL